MSSKHIDLQATGSNLKKLRLNAGYSVRELVKHLSLSSPQAVYKWERGDCIPSVDNLLLLSKIYGVSVDKIIVLR